MKDFDRFLIWAVLTAWVGAATYLRVWGLDLYTYSPDEAIHVAEAATDSLAALFGWLAREDTHPPLHYLLVRGLLTFGESELLLRGPSILAGLALIPVLFSLARSLVGTAAGLFLAFVTTFGYDPVRSVSFCGAMIGRVRNRAP